MINFPSWSRNAHRGKLNPMPGADGIFISPILSTAFFLQQLPHFPSVAFSFNQLLSVCTPRPSVLLSYQSQGFFNLIDAPQSPGGFKARHKAAITQPLFPRRGKKKKKRSFSKKGCALIVWRQRQLSNVQPNGLSQLKASKQLLILLRGALLC